MEERHETSGVTTRLILRYVREQGGEDAVGELLRRAAVALSREELEDESRWVSYATRIRLFEAATEVLGDPDCPYAMGAEAMRAGLNHGLVLLLRALGSPAQVYRQLPRSVPKFSTTSTMEVLEAGRSHVTLRFTLHDGFVHSMLDCRYAQGLIGTVPEIFGLPRARVEHSACQSDGHPACLYRVSWMPLGRRWWGRRRPVEDPELVALRRQLEELQSAAADLGDGTDLDACLRRITRRAATAVLAPSYLLAVHDPAGGPPLIHAEGLPPRRAEALAHAMLAGEDLGAGAVVVEVASGRRCHGRLAALYGEGQVGPADERPMLQAYAGHAAAVLDLVMALADSRRNERRATALLAFAHDLQSATRAEDIARVIVRAVPGIVGCDTTTVFFWQPGPGELRPIASVGLTDEEHALLHSAPITPEESPELIDLLTRHEPSLLRPGPLGPRVGGLLDALELDAVVAMPLLAGGEVLGVATACWRVGNVAADVDEALTRLRAVAEYAATSIDNARLLETVRHQSLHDALTGLPNRVMFARLLDEALLRTEDGRVAVLFCDLDKFKHVNDSMGHASGDELLRQVAARLLAVIRGGDVVARLSGDEFAVLLPDVPSEDAAEGLARRVVAAFDEPFRVDGRELRVTTSVGVAVQPAEPGGGDRLLRRADGAMYAAKRRGRNQVATAADGPAVHAGSSAESPYLAVELRHAIERGQLRLHFQPLVEVPPVAAGARDRAGVGDAPAAGAVVGGDVVGVEALLRWQHPSLGLLGPNVFLPLAEETGLIVQLDRWALVSACAAVAGWQRSSGRALGLAVNISAASLLDPELVTVVREVVTAHGLAPQQLTLEVVESRSLTDVEGVAARLGRLRHLGVRVALDDFGTGYSTLTWLQQLPVDQVKMDRTFTSALGEDPEAAALVHGVVALTASLGVEAVAEGVETEVHAQVLRDAGFSVMQGYWYGRPQAALPLPSGTGPDVVAPAS